MAKNIELNVELRERVGKGGAREARRNGLVPAVLYGGGEDPVAITLKNNELLKAFNTGKFRGNTVTIVHKGDKQLVIPQDIQFHPVSDKALHVDLYRVTADQVVSVEVQVNFVGEEECPGMKKGGTLTLEIGDNVKISDINLPEGATPTITDRDFTIATIAGRTAEVVEETPDADAEEGAEGEAEGGEGDAE